MSTVRLGFKPKLHRELILFLLVLLSALTAIGVAIAADANGSAPGETGPQEVPLTLDRIYATANEKININGLDEKRVDVDIAVIDSGIKLDHRDLNIVARTNCTGATKANGYSCTNASPNDGNDNEEALWHGTESALNIGALDNRIGRVGIAAGARLWAVDVHKGVLGPSNTPQNLESAIAGVKWVTAHAAEIEVAHFAFKCAPAQIENGPLPRCDPKPGDAKLAEELEDAVEESISKGVVYVAPAGNTSHDVSMTVPQSFDDVFVVSGMGDTDGKPGSEGGPACWFNAPDDTSWGEWGAWGAGVDVTAPGCATSHTSTLVTGAAAILASRDNPEDAGDVEEIGEAIFGDGDCSNPEAIGSANCEWTDSSPDEVQEPLLDVGDEGLFDPEYVSPYLPDPPGSSWPEVKDAATGQSCGELTIDWPDVSGGCIVNNFEIGFFSYKETSPCFQPGGKPGGHSITIGELHIAGDGTFAAENVSPSCGFYGAERCDAEPGDSLYFYPDKKVEDVLHYPPWMGTYAMIGGVPYVYMTLCSAVTQVGPQAKWVDSISAQLFDAEIEGQTYYEWSFLFSASDAWLKGSGFTAAYMEQAPGVLIEWN